jgi:hypothetical protein
MKRLCGTKEVSLIADATDVPPTPGNGDVMLF